MRRENLYVDIHVLQTVPPSCVNRDDTGSPKTAVYGGTTRARVSSQSWKRAMRLMFENEIFSTDMVGKRTKLIPEELAKEILALDVECKDSSKMAKTALENAGIKVKDKALDALFFISRPQLRKLAELIVSGEKDKNLYKSALKESPSIDIALFGRMVASDPSLNFDAAAQVAHSISTHTIHNEYDYFTAVDDCSPEDNSGAGHLGTVEYNSSTLYRYATVNVMELKKNLEEDAVIAVKGLVEAFVKAMPDGKQNTFANRTVPNMVYVTIRKDQPVNLCGAFERPVISVNDGFVRESEKRLIKYAKEVYDSFADAPVKSYGVGMNEELKEIAETMSMKNMLSELEIYLSECIKEVK